MQNEQWRPLIGHERYALSNMGRLRSEYCLMTPNTTTKSAASARYQLYVPATRMQASIKVSVAMRMVWGLDFVPTYEWIQMVRAEVKAEVEAARTAPRGKAAASIKPAAPKQKPPKPPVAPPQGIPCPWASGKLDTCPREIATWDCAQMDPMTPRDENGLWFYVPASAKERRKIRIEYAKARREAHGGRVAA